MSQRHKRVLVLISHWRNWHRDGARADTHRIHHGAFKRWTLDCYINGISSSLKAIRTIPTCVWCMLIPQYARAEWKQWRNNGENDITDYWFVFIGNPFVNQCRQRGMMANRLLTLHKVRWLRRYCAFTSLLSNDGRCSSTEGVHAQIGSSIPHKSQSNWHSWWIVHQLCIMTR